MSEPPREGGPAVAMQTEDALVTPDNPPWGVLAAVGVWLASVLLLAFLQIFAVIPYALSQGLDAQAVAEFISTDKTAILLSLVAVFPAHLLTLALVWAVVTRFGKMPFWHTLGWSWSENFGLWTSVALAVGLLILGAVLTKIFGAQETALEQMLNSSYAARLTIAALATFTAPLVEETVYRGVLYSALQRRIGAMWAITGVLILFTLVHVPQYYQNLSVVVTVGLLSLALTLVRARTGKLLPCVVIHLIFNGIQSLIIVFEPFKNLLPETKQQTQGCLAPLVAHAAQLLF